MSPARHFLEVDDLTGDELQHVLEMAAATHHPRPLEGRTAALIFEKPSLRTRNSSEVAIVQLGGQPLTMFRDEVGLGQREPVCDVARVLSRYHAAISARVFGHSLVEEMAEFASVPVVNLLSDDGHPCQALADLLTLQQRFDRTDGLTVAYIGDFNNVARSLAIGLAMCGSRIHLACPAGYGPTPEDVDRIRIAGVEPLVTTRPDEAARGVDAIYADVWASMGQESEADDRRRAFEGFTIDDRLMNLAAERAVFLHCLPAHRGEEVAAEVVDGARSAVWDQAENRLHAYRGLLLFLLDESD